VALAVVVPATLFWRPHYQAALAGPVSDSDRFGTEWTLGMWWVDPSGHRLDRAAYNRLVAALAGQDVRPGTWLRQHGYVPWQSYQPNGRFWAFQAVEAGWLCALALVLAAGTLWWVGRAG
jgi:hypothetical protein